MAINHQEIEHLKRLARLELSDEETDAIQEDLNALLGYFETIRELATDGVQELTRPTESYNVFRQDVVQASLSHHEAMSVATEQQDGFFKVPRTVEIE